MHESLNILIDLFFPEGLKEFFELKSHKFDADNLHLHLEEINIIPEEYKLDKLESKGFYPEFSLQDYPIRGLNVFLHIKRCRWLNHTTSKVVYRDWQLVANGTRITKGISHLF